MPRVWNGHHHPHWIPVCSIPPARRSPASQGEHSVPPLVLPTVGPDFICGVARTMVWFIVLIHSLWWSSAGLPGGYPQGVLTASFANLMPVTVPWQSFSVSCTSLSASLAQLGVPHWCHTFQWKLFAIQYPPLCFWGHRNELSWPV